VSKVTCSTEQINKQTN